MKILVAACAIFISAIDLTAALTELEKEIVADYEVICWFNPGRDRVLVHAKKTDKKLKQILDLELDKLIKNGVTKTTLILINQENDSVVISKLVEKNGKFIFVRGKKKFEIEVKNLFIGAMNDNFQEAQE